MTGNHDTRAGRVRKRAPTACVRCRRQKIKCSGTPPCEQCKRRRIECHFDDREPKTLVNQSYLAELERLAYRNTTQDSAIDMESRRDTAYTATEEIEDSNLNDDQESIPAEADLINPLDPSLSDSFTLNPSSKPYFLGVSSNASFGIRVLTLVHQRAHASPASAENLLFEGSMYELDWNGQRSAEAVDTSIIPTADFALFLINAVKFHCGRLYHLFDETTFMQNFAAFYEDRSAIPMRSRLWYVHFLLILAFGKAFNIRASKSSRANGMDLFTQAMQLLPDITALHKDAIQAIEVLSCAALYLQCLDLRSAAYSIIGQAMRMTVEQGMFTEMQSQHLSTEMVERCREIWWTVYILDRQMTSLMGVPIGFSDDDISAPLPAFGGNARKSVALRLQVELARASAVILQTVYRKTTGQEARFLKNMKDSLRIIGQANEERNAVFPLDLKNSNTSIDRLAAYLHMLHHQALILATRPLLFSYLQKRMASNRPQRVSSMHGSRSLLRVCVSSAQHCLSILEMLQQQSLLESWLPFDREAVYSSALVLIIAQAVDRSLVLDTHLELVYNILDEMTMRGSLLAEHHKRELDRIVAAIEVLNTSDANSQRTQSMSYTFEQSRPYTASSASYADVTSSVSNTAPSNDFDAILGEWNSEDELSGERLLVLADSLDLDQMQWFTEQAFS